MTWKFLTPKEVKQKRIELEELRKFRIIKSELKRLKNSIGDILLPSPLPSTIEIKQLPEGTLHLDWDSYFDLKLNRYFDDAPDKTFRELLDDSGWKIEMIENKGFLIKPKD